MQDVGSFCIFSLAMRVKLQTIHQTGHEGLELAKLPKCIRQIGQRSTVFCCSPGDFHLKSSSVQGVHTEQRHGARPQFVRRLLFPVLSSVSLQSHQVEQSFALCCLSARFVNVRQPA